MRSVIIFYVFVCFGCMAQKKDYEKLVGDWIENNRIRYDRLKWMAEEDSTKYHFIFYANGKFEDRSYEPQLAQASRLCFTTKLKHNL